MGFGWEGTKTRLVPLDKARHLENYVRWLNDPEVTRCLLIGDLPLTRIAEEEFFDKAGKPSESDVIFAVETLDGEHVGGCGIHHIKLRHGEGTTGTIIGRRDLWGQGYATDAVRTRTRYAFEVLGLRNLLSEVFADNPASLRVLLKAGYREYGRIPQRTWKHGCYHDVIMLLLERERWRTFTSASGGK